MPRVRNTGIFLFLLGAALAAEEPSRRAAFMPYAAAQPYLVAMAEVAPAEMKGAVPGADAEAKWNLWVRQRDKEIRARLIRGEEDSVINLLLFGTSFTRQPRVTPADLGAPAAGGNGSAPAEPSALVRARLDDLVAGIAAPGANERLQFARHLAELWGLAPEKKESREPVKQYLLDNLRRVLGEQQSYQRALAGARQLGNSSEEFAERSKLYRQRGLSLDTSLAPDFALEQSLAAMLQNGLLAPGSVRRVAIIGPGLDFTDKSEGYDFYPQQTIQPFAVMDSLVRLKLAALDQIEVATLDLSPRVNDHLMRARARAAKKSGYTVQLPRDAARGWKPELVRYWEKFGDQIGAPATPVAPPAAATHLKVRAVRIRPEAVLRIQPADTNIVLQRLTPAPAEQFDLVIATNVLVYYDVFEQSLALANIQHMLRPGGFLLSNNALLELPFSKMHSVSYLTVVYSDRPDDGDHIVWYQRAKE